jgi:hypothetical protein
LSKHQKEQKDSHVEVNDPHTQTLRKKYKKKAPVEDKDEYDPTSVQPDKIPPTLASTDVRISPQS